MPSDDRTAAAIRALESARQAYRAAVIAAADELRAYRARPAVAATAGHGLGPFAVGRVDVDRFDALFAGVRILDASADERIAAAAAVLDEFATLGVDGFAIRIPPGGDLAAETRAALSRLGRPFAAARAVALARAGAPDEGAVAYRDGLPFTTWNRAERLIAPPLVVELGGSDLRVAGLAELLDGVQKLVLVVHGETPPAALVRLVTPGVFVAQASDVGLLSRVADFAGPAVVALVPDAAASFVHDPTARPRLVIERLPSNAPRRALGSLSLFQQTEELAQLRALADAAGTAAQADAAPAAAPADPADRLAAWLLRQARMDGAGTA
jgi:hypothetical protein